MVCEGSQPVPALPWEVFPGVFRQYLLECGGNDPPALPPFPDSTDLPFYKVTFLFGGLVGIRSPSFSGSWLYVPKSSFSFSLGISLPRCPASCSRLLQAPPGLLPLRCFTSLAEMGHLWSKSCAQSQDSLQEMLIACEGSTEQSLAPGVPQQQVLGRHISAFLISAYKALKISYTIKSMQVFFFRSWCENSSNRV